MFAGEAVNSTEGRAALHTLLRHPPGNAPPGLAWALAQVHETLDAMLAYAERVRADADITDVVCMGIGGSGLGPQMAVQALQGLGDARRRMHFVSNVDGHALQAVLVGLQPRSTLFIVASKVFNTQETLTNARSALDWFHANGGSEVSRHFVALTTHAAAAAQMGITTTFGFWDWVGGRYSLWSSIGLPVAVAVGAAAFRAMLAGAHAMDMHFRTSPLQANLPVRLGLLDVWYRNLLGFGSRCIAPYHAGGACRPICSNWRWRATASAWTGRAGRWRWARHPCSGVSPARMGSMPSSRCCTRAATSCRWRSLR